MKAAIGNVQGGFVLAGNINAVNALLKQISDEDALALSLIHIWGRFVTSLPAEYRSDSMTQS